MEHISNFTLHDILTPENVISVKRTSPASWANVVKCFLNKKNKTVLSERDLDKKCFFLANFFRRKSRKRSIESLVQEYKKNFSEQIINAREISTLDELILKFDKISFGDEEDRRSVICRLCQKEQILVTRKFCQFCLDKAIMEAIDNINERMEHKQLKPCKKRKLSESFDITEREIRPRDSSFLPLKPEYKIPKQRAVFNDDQDYDYITALSGSYEGDFQT